MLTDYTTYAAVRAVLGVSALEIEDSTLALPMYEVLLTEDLTEVNDSLLASYATAKALTSPTAEATRFINILQTYASYLVASTLLGSVPMFAPKTINDSKASMDRIADPFKKLAESVSTSLTYIRSRLLAAYEVYNPAEVKAATVTRTFIKISTGLDPVTNA